MSNTLNLDSLRDMVGELKDDITKLFEGGKFVDYLTHVSSFYNYSPYNILLIQKQFPHATCVASFTEWNKRGYKVKKGSKGIKIICPVIKKDEFDEERLVRFTFRYVFDISQVVKVKEVAGFDIGDNVPLDIELAFESLMLDQENPATLVDWSDLPHALGTYSPMQGSIKIRRDAPVAMFKTLLHEKRHAISMGNDYYKFDHNVAEVIAESAAYVACMRFGLTSTESFDYIGQFCKDKSADELDQYLNEIVTTARKLIKWVTKVTDLEVVA